MEGDIISRSKLKEDFADMSIDEAPTVWHPFTEEPTEEGQYLVQHFYKTWSGKTFISYEVVNSLKGLMGLIDINKRHGNRDNHYQAWQKIDPYEEENNE